MKKTMIIILLGCFMFLLAAPLASEVVAQTNDTTANVERKLQEPFFAVLEGIKTNPDLIFVDTAEGKVPWKQGYTIFYDFNENKISAVTFLESYRNTGVGLWLDENGIAAELRPVNM